MDEMETSNLSVDHDEWCLLDKDSEFESIVAGMGNGDLGKSLLEISSFAQDVAAGPAERASDEQLGATLLSSMAESTSTILNSQSSVASSSSDLQYRATIAELSLEIERLQTSLAQERQAHGKTQSKVNLLQATCNTLTYERDHWKDQCSCKAEISEHHNMALVSTADSLRQRMLELARVVHAHYQADSAHCNDASMTLVPPTVSLDDLFLSLHSIFSEVEANTLSILTQHACTPAPTAAPSDILSASSSIAQQARISLCGFQENDIALFFPTQNGDYLAFNVGGPHHYLSPESKALIGQDRHFRKIYVLGRIVYKEKKESTKDHSPYKLVPGITYYEVTLTSASDFLEYQALKA